MKISCPHCDADIDVIQEDLQLSCPSCGSRLHLLDETLLQVKEEPKVVAHFELLEQVGRGHFGDVWKARDAVLNRLVAVKIPRTGGLDQRTVQLFVREARAAANLRHENIVTVHQVFLDDQAVYIVSDLINGVTLAEQMRQKHRTPREAAELCATIAEALHYAHNNGVEAHRDIKPGNVMVDTAGKPYLMDFGLAKLDTADFTMTVAGQLLGTPAYMSPEQAQGKETDRHTDIYSLGIILYELLTHSRPFSGDTKLLIHQIVSEEPLAPRRVNKSIPRPLETICLKAIAKDPKRRYATAADFAADLRRFLNGEPILAKPVSRIERTWRWARRNPAITGSVAALALLLMTLAAVLWQQQEERLAGFRNVTLATEPSGAQIVFVPLTDLREPVIDRIVRPSGRSPVDVPLSPGNYLVIARISDNEFHEVYRYVPHDPEERLGPQNHSRWEVRPDGTILLPTVNIPKTSDAIKDMTLFTGGNFEMGSNNLSDAPKHVRSVADFYLDQNEVAIRDYQTLKSVPKALAGHPDDEPVTLVDFAQALDFAELVGKRLMTETEYEYAATDRGTRDFPWGDDADRVVPEIFQRQPVGKPDFDQTATQPPVFGLDSNVTEWTDSVLIPYPRQGNMSSPSDEFRRQLAASRVLRGGPITDDELPAGTMSAKLLRGSRRRAAQYQNVQRPYIGFRCARSVKPRFFE